MFLDERGFMWSCNLCEHFRRRYEVDTTDMPQNGRDLCPEWVAEFQRSHRVHRSSKGRAQKYFGNKLLSAERVMVRYEKDHGKKVHATVKCTKSDHALSPTPQSRNYMRMRVCELQTLCAKYGIESTGRCKDLAKRLRSMQSQEAGA